MKPEPQTINSRLQSAAVTAAPLQDGQSLAIPLDRIEGNAYQPRHSMDEADLQRLMDSIAQGSLLQNVVVRPLTAQGQQWDPATGRFALIAGHRRWTAFQRLLAQATDAGDAAGIKRFSAIPAIVRFGLTEEDQAIHALEENIHRADLNPWEEATAVVRIREVMAKKAQREVTDAEIADRLGYGDEKRVERLRLIADRSPPFLQKAMTGELRIRKDKDSGRPRLDFLAAYEFTRLFDHVIKHAVTPKQAERVHERIEHLVQKALEEGWPLRRIQTHVTTHLSAVKAGRKRAEDVSDEAPVAEEKPLFKRDEKRKTLTASLVFDGASPEALKALMAALDEVSAAARAALEKGSVSAT